jgi:type I restriction enzyme S subunit
VFQPPKERERKLPLQGAGGLDWIKTTLGEVVDFVVDNRGKTPPLVEDGYELLEVNAISDNAREPDYSKVSKFVDEETFRNGFRKGTVKKGDVLIPTVGTIGNVAYSKEDRGAIAQNLIALRTKIEHNSLFLYYFLTDPNTKKALLNLDIGGVQPSIKVPHLLDMQVVFPPLPEQIAIASVLSAFDDKIELLREENKTLEEIGQTIFGEWFGKYSPDRPDDLPKGWRVGKLGEVVDIF